jgi:hypothetical protein
MFLNYRMCPSYPMFHLFQEHRLHLMFRLNPKNLKFHWIH